MMLHKYFIQHTHCFWVTFASLQLLFALQANSKSMANKTSTYTLQNVPTENLECKSDLEKVLALLGV